MAVILGKVSNAYVPVIFLFLELYTCGSDIGLRE